MRIQRRISWIIGGLVALALMTSAGNPALAIQRDVSSQVAVAQTPPPGPDDLTWAEMAKIEKGTATFGENAGNGMALAAASCTLDTRYVYMRESGYQKYPPYGAAGGKPKTTCTVPMVSIRHTTNMYKTVWWGYQHVGGPFEGGNYGVSSYEQKNVEVPCADARNTTFRMVVASVGTFPDGQTAGGSAYEEANLPCGTNP